MSSPALILRLLSSENQRLPIHCASDVGVWIIAILHCGSQTKVAASSGSHSSRRRTRNGAQLLLCSVRTRGLKQTSHMIFAFAPKRWGWI